MESQWNTVLLQAAQCLHRACEGFAKKLEQDEAGVKELRELTAAIKELTVLHRQLNPDEDAGNTTVEVSFDDAADAWSR